MQDYLLLNKIKLHIAPKVHAGNLSILILVTIIILLSASSYFSPLTPTRESSIREVPALLPGNDSFIISSFNSGWDLDFKYVNDTALGFNVWHLYNGSFADASGKNYPLGWIYWAKHDSLQTPVSSYSSDLNRLFDSMSAHNMKALMIRPKIEYLCYGQRSDYQCEASNIPEDLWFYAFLDHPTGSDIVDNSPYGKREWVRYCRKNPNLPGGGAGWVVKRLMANTEQSNPGNNFHNGDDNKCLWLIKPRIRIDSAYANNPANFNMPVCSLTVKNQDGVTFKNVVLYVRNFKASPNSIYNGDYLEEYFYGPQDTAKLRYLGAWGTYYRFEARTDGNEHLNHADIQVYWFGNCDMWIDRVRVDDDRASNLLSTDTANQTHKLYNEWIESEVTQIACHNHGAAAYRHYIELFDFNSLPCMKYVNHKLDSISFANCSKHITLMCIPIPFFYSGHVWWGDRMRVMDVEHMKRNLMDDVGIQEIFLGIYQFNSSYHFPEEYPNYCTWSKIPNTLAHYNVPGTLANPVPPAQYDDWLQMYLDSIPYSFEAGYSSVGRSPVEEDQGSFRFTMQFGDALSKATGKPFIFNPQAHIWFCQCGAPKGDCNSRMTGEVQREPTNEELDLTSNLAVSYGVKGLIWFEMLSYDTVGQDFYSAGIMNSYVAGMPGLPRDTNVYGERKYDKMKEISKRMKAWGPYLMSFDNSNRRSCIFRMDSERNLFIENSYVKEVLTFSAPSVNYWGLPANPPEVIQKRYVQIATFHKPIEPYVMYFMLVNRRCSPFRPEINEDGGRRFLKISFDYGRQEFLHSGRWRITDLGSNSTVVEFSKDLMPVIDLGWFKPGEGKLYKMEPTGQ